MEQSILQRNIARPTLPPESAGLSCGGALPAGTCLREFEITETIGEGGFSIVYAALDRQLGREVAIKEYIPASLAGRAAGHSVHIRSEQHRESFEAGLAGFMNEARLLAQFKHPALVEVLQFWEENGTAYMVMPRYRGKTLRQQLKDRGGSCDERWLKRTLNPILDVLNLLHARSVYHRDVAPDNILVQNDGSAVLLDLGSAREILQDRESSVTVVVKPGYAPLEQYSGEFALPQGPWTDVYAFGALLHFAVTGTPPQASISRVMKDSCTSLAASPRPGFSTEFLAAIDHALKLQPADRPQSAMELRTALAMDVLPAITAASTAAASEALAMLHHDDAITAIVSAEEMADIVDQVARAVAAPATSAAVDAFQPDAPAGQASALASSQATGVEDPPRSRPTSDQIADPFAAASPGPEASVSSFDDVDDLISGRLVGTTEDVRVVSESRLESRIDSDQSSGAQAPRRRTLQWAFASLACVFALAAGIALWPQQAPQASAEASVTERVDEPNLPAAEASGRLASNAVAQGRESTSESPLRPASVSVPAPAAVTLEPFPVAPAQAPGPADQLGTDDWLMGPAPTPAAAMPLDVWANPTTPTEAAPEIVVETAQPLAEVRVESAAQASTSTAPSRPRASSIATVPVRINVMPWAEVWIDGKRAGDSPPIKQLDLAPGRHELELRNGSFPPLRRQLDLKADQPVSVEHRFSSSAGG